jgi:ectoine hydroxylase-related dioxygenase (phytanoyl-CoA dioxygenase family)
MSDKIANLGFDVLPEIISEEALNVIIDLISIADTSGAGFRKSNDLFAIRQFFKYIPAIADIVMSSKLGSLVKETFGEDYFVVKSIYFDKPPASNWFVSYHQDLTISVSNRIAVDGFGSWTLKEGQFAVQPPLEILQDNITIRIHLDDTSIGNGALKVIPGSHLKGIYRPETINWDIETEVDCEVPRGGAMIMKPLLLHSSGRTLNNKRRRVIHIEFSRYKLPEGLQWAELLHLPPAFEIVFR